MSSSPNTVMTKAEAERPALLDVNVLLALSWDQHAHHEVAHSRFDRLDQWRTTPATESGLLRLLLTSAVTGRNVTAGEALQHLEALRSVDGWGWLPDDSSFTSPLIDLRSLMGRRQVTDFHLVNLVAHSNATLITFDSALRDSLVPEDRHWVETWSA